MLVIVLGIIVTVLAVAVAEWVSRDVLASLIIGIIVATGLLVVVAATNNYWGERIEACATHKEAR